MREGVASDGGEGWRRHGQHVHGTPGSCEVDSAKTGGKGSRGALSSSVNGRHSGRTICQNMQGIIWASRPNRRSR